MQRDPEPRVPSLRFDSEHLRARDRFEAWRTAVASIQDTLPPDEAAGAAFRVRTTVWNLGGAVVAHGSYSAHRSDRSAALIRRGGGGYRLSVMISGAPGRMAAGDERLLYGPGDVVVTDLDRPSGYEGRGVGESVAVYLPRPVIDGLLPWSARAPILVLKGPMADLLRRHLVGLAGALRDPATPAAAAPALGQATAQLFAAALAGVVPREGEVRGAVEDALLRRITGFVEDRLLDPGLSQDLLCRTFHMSRATLYRLFQPLGGVASYVQERRLARVHEALLDPAHHHHLGRLAETHGFSSAAQMSRAYKARYGTSPSAAGGPVLAAPNAVTDGAAVFGRWTRGLGR